MSWGAVAGAAVGLVGSYMSAKDQKKAMQKANQGSGQVNMTTTSNPWGPSANHRQNIMHQADRLQRSRDAGMNPFGQRNGRNGGRGGGGGGGGASNWSGSQGMADALSNRATSGHPLYEASTNYVQNTLAGNDTNAYRGRAFENFENLNDPNVQKMIDYLYGQLPGGGGAGGGGGGGGGGGVFAISGGGYTNKMDPYIKDVLDGKYLDPDNPQLAAYNEMQQRKLQEQFENTVLPGLQDRYGGNGRLGSNAFDQGIGNATGQYAQASGDMLTDIYYQDYNNRMGDLMQAMGYGTDLDIAGMNNATSRAGIAASSASNQAALKNQYNMALLDSLGGAVGLSSGLTGLGAQGMGGLAEGFSGDQQFALGMTPELTGMDIRDMESAFGANLALDQGRARERGASASRRQQQQQWESQQPWNDLRNYMDIINAASGGYGTTTEVGTDGRGYAPNTNYPDPWAQALSGGLAGWNMGRQFKAGEGGGPEGGGGAPEFSTWFPTTGQGQQQPTASGFGGTASQVPGGYNPQMFPGGGYF